MPDTQADPIAIANVEIKFITEVYLGQSVDDGQKFDSHIFRSITIKLTFGLKFEADPQVCWPPFRRIASNERFH